METGNPTKKQHFLPQFYLKRFADSKGFLQIYDKKLNKIVSPHPYQSEGYSNYFYAQETGVPDDISQHIEKWLRTYEDIISRELVKIIDNLQGHDHISNDDKYILAALMCMLWLRTPTMRAQLNRSHEDLYKQIMRLGPKQSVDNFITGTGTTMTANERDNLINMIETGAYDMRFNNIQHLRFMTETFGFNDKGFTNMFFAHKWKIYLAKGKKQFITTDNPVIEWCLPPATFYGASFLERSKYFALTPSIYIELTEPKGSEKINRKTLYADQDDIVRTLNMFLASRKSNFVYSNDKLLLEEILQGRTNPGPLERAIYQKYDYPWDLYWKKLNK